MKYSILKVILITFLMAASSLMAQAPQKMSYQMVVRNASNTLVTNSPVRVITSVYRTSPSGQLVFQDWHLVTTNANGLASFEIGTGTNQFGDFTTIDWSNGPYFLKTEVDPNGNFTFSVVGSSQLLSVPYALFAEKSNPVNPVFQSSESPNAIFTNARNTWVNYPYTNLTVAKSGLYLLTFNGNVINSNTYSGTTFDAKAAVRVFNTTTNAEILVMDATAVDQFYIGTNYYKYSNLQPSRSLVVRLNQGEVLTVDYMQTILAGATAPTQNWMPAATSLHILKVGD